jgi:rhodanese-related sulfurtransferase
MFNLFGSKNKDTNIEQIDVDRFEALRNELDDVVVLDVRTPEENADGAIPNSILMDINSANFPEKTSSLDPSKSYLIYCRSGMRSMRACSYLSGKGFTKLYNLEGGYLAWSREHA